jgi:hypothetical protein
VGIRIQKGFYKRFTKSQYVDDYNTVKLMRNKMKLAKAIVAEELETDEDMKGVQYKSILTSLDSDLNSERKIQNISDF